MSRKPHEHVVELREALNLLRDPIRYIIEGLEIIEKVKQSKPPVIRARDCEAIRQKNHEAYLRRKERALKGSMTVQVIRRKRKEPAEV